ncbi:hypothetical protein CEXT_43671 [Caerostris extrusa]|uniref:Uncharacterized protein n=1 Tax=Caerostris extrusa TaxID=172846 RepID=A0AAV4Y7K3_CAEEX|nr:hypothetical protein CEXT_43671 [Caerostris extrusa]
MLVCIKQIEKDPGLEKMNVFPRAINLLHSPAKILSHRGSKTKISTGVRDNVHGMMIYTAHFCDIVKDEMSYERRIDHMVAMASRFS